MNVSVFIPILFFVSWHYSDVIMSTMASQITSLTIVYSNVYSGAHQRKHQSSASSAFVRGIHRWPVNSPNKGPVTRKMFPFDDVIMKCERWVCIWINVTHTVFFLCFETKDKTYIREDIHPMNKMNVGKNEIRIKLTSFWCIVIVTFRTFLKCLKTFTKSYNAVEIATWAERLHKWDIDCGLLPQLANENSTGLIITDKTVLQTRHNVGITFVRKNFLQQLTH